MSGATNGSCGACRGIAWILLTTLILPGCSVWRGLPSHGGGKRFDEEQRVVSGAICRAVTDMDLKELKGRKVAVTFESVAQNGGGQVEFPHIDSLRASYLSSASSGFEWYDFAVPETAPGTNYRNNFNDGSRRDKTLSVDIQPYTSYRPTTYPTDIDMKYLQAVLGMKADHLNIQINSKAPEVMLTVLVNVLGTNLSRQDSLIYWKDQLKATCEITYYAKDLKTNGLLFAARQSSSEALYEESSIIGFAAFRVRRSIRSAPPTPFPIDTALGVPTPTAAEAATATDSVDATPAAAVNGEREDLQKKLAQADMQIQAGNLEEAQRLVNQVRLANPSFPGLDDIAAKIQAARRNGNDASN